MPLNHIQPGHEYIFIRGSKSHGEDMVRMFDFLGIKNDDNVKCDDECKFYGIIPTGKYSYEHKYKIGEFRMEEIKNHPITVYGEFYMLDLFKKKYIDPFPVGAKVFVRLYDDYNDARVGKIGLVRLIHGIKDEVEYKVDLSNENDPAHHLVRFTINDIIGPYDSIARCMWNNISRYSNNYPEEKEIKYSNTPHTESDDVLVWDSFYGPRIDKRWNGEWLSERINREKKVITPAVCHYDVAWMPITPPKDAERLR